MQSLQDLFAPSDSSDTPPRHALEASPELLRIAAIPRRTWAPEAVRALVKDLTDLLRVPGGKEILYAEQAIALLEAWETKGLFAPLPVGCGKTLISFLLPVLLSSRRPVLLVPAALGRKTDRELNRYAQAWKVARNLRVVSYEKLSRVSAATMLDEYEPDLLILDECHRAKNPKAACTKRIHRYLKAHPQTRVCALSGTITKRSIKDYAHLLNWAFPGGPPCPRTWGELEVWSDVLDEKLRPGARRVAPGAMLQLLPAPATPAPDPDDSQIVLARRAYQRRLAETKGVVIGSTQDVECSLRISDVSDVEVPFEVRRALDTTRQTWELPDGYELIDGPSMWKALRELSLGFYYAWDPRPPSPWKEARKAWAAFVRETIQTHSAQRLDTELQVALACYHGQLDPTVWRAWKAIEPTFRPNVVARWISTFALDEAKKWAHDHKSGLIWVYHREFGERLSEHLGIPYYSSEAIDAKTRRYVMDHKSGPAAISIESGSTGLNLQELFSENLVTLCPPNNLKFEQLVGRTHRRGQTADEVTVEVWAWTQELQQSLYQVRSDALYMQDTTGMPQKVLTCDWLVS